MVEPNEILDVRNEICTFREIKTLKKLKQMKPGNILEILTDYALSIARISRIAEKKGHLILAIDKIGKSEWKILMKI
ncbi:MAG: sulfurtransferase TusA family protein [Promethearchaeota archaeon]